MDKFVMTVVANVVSGLLVNLITALVKQYLENKRKSRK